MSILERSVILGGFLPGVLFLALLLPALPSGASELEDNLSVYSEKNATAYMQPLGDLIGTDLNSGLFRSARIPESGFRLSFEIPAMMTKVSNDDRTFRATTEQGFFPEQTVDAPTVVGPGEAVIVDGVGDTQFAFPGGLSLNSVPLAMIQVRIGRLYGTEAIFRYISADVSDEELAKVKLFGLGLQHSISQYLERQLPLDLSAGFFWQSYKIGENQSGSDLIKGGAFTIGAQGSRQFGTEMIYIEPYGGLALDTHSMEVSYESEASGEVEDVTLNLERSTNLHLTIGALFKIYYIGGYADYGFTGRNTFTFGLIIGN
ncbi:MAG: hypothetical protein PVJ42_02990 [bacterium]